MDYRKCGTRECEEWIVSTPDFFGFLRSMVTIKLILIMHPEHTHCAVY